MTGNYNKKKFSNSLFPTFKFSILLLAIAFIAGTSYAQTWVPVGTIDFSDSTAKYTSIAIGRLDTPYVVYQDLGHSGRATVKKFNGSSWVNVGIPGFSTGEVLYTRIAIDSSGIPYVLYSDMSLAGHGRATVMKYNGSAWVTVGISSFSLGQILYPSLAIDPTGGLYVTYQDQGTTDDEAMVMKYNGSYWATVGSGGISYGEGDFTSIAVDGSGTPYVIFADTWNFGMVTVVKYMDTSWISILPSSPSLHYGEFTSIAIDNSGTPYISYTQGSPIVMKYIDSAFVVVGIPSFSPVNVQSTSMVIDPSGVPYVAYENDGTPDFGAGVMNFNGFDWVTTGNSGFSPPVIQDPSIAINKTGVPYIAYGSVITGKASVMKLDTTLHPIAGRDTICIGDTTTLTDATIAGTWSSSSPYIASINTGVATGLITGTTTISYIVPEGTATFLLTVGTCITGVKNISTTPSSLSIFPNPSTGSFTLNLSSTAQTAAITVTNAIGQKVKELTIPVNKDIHIQLDTPPGVYFISATAGGEKMNGKIVVQ